MVHKMTETESCLWTNKYANVVNIYIRFYLYTRTFFKVMI